MGPTSDPFEGSHFWLAAGSYTARRFLVWSGVPIAAAAPSAGGAVDGVSGSAAAASGVAVYYAARGLCFTIETGGAYSSGAALKTDANGKAIAQGGSGTIVATALEASGGVGEFRLCKFV